MPVAKTDAPKRFELPALDFNFESLTDGTGIPPPLPSPVTTAPAPIPNPTSAAVTKRAQNAAPKTAVTSETTTASKAVGASPNGNSTISISSPPAPSATRGSKRRADDSPTTTRHGSLRRLLSRSLLNHAYAEDKAMTTSTPTTPGLASARPSSGGNGSITDDKKAKRRSGWFQRLRSSDGYSKRSSIILDEPKKSGPPPPMIPELRTLETNIDLGNAGTISDELFFKTFK
ncbi:hypothetical protein Cpir12675_002382 [Ceratocystis pirilliformis]|uniref:Uncharacterized protein n=1 Tax=Ceratocystis pirilliformis TaxID=259994 RepID=A0ABR3Z9D1_9PEZI